MVLTSWFTGTVHAVDRQSDQTKQMLHGFKAPTHALLWEDGSFIVAEMARGNGAIG